MTQTITCKYSCVDCGLTNIETPVPVRDSRQDVVEWTERVMIMALCADHARRSPHCRPKSLKNVMVPMTGAEYVGGPAVN